MSIVNIKPITNEYDDLIVKWKNSLHVKEQVFNRSVLTIDIHRNWIENFVYKAKAFQFIIFVENDIPVGSIFLKNIDKINRKAEMGIFIGEKRYIGKGVGTRSIKLLLSFAFSNLKLNKVYLNVFSKNKKAINAYKRSGFQVDGVLREEYFFEVFLDVTQMSITYSDWKKVKFI